jgi:hypothetical protein
MGQEIILELFRILKLKKFLVLRIHKESQMSKVKIIIYNFNIKIKLLMRICKTIIKKLLVKIPEILYFALIFLERSYNYK